MRYLPETMTKQQLRKCYSRYAIAMILYIVGTIGLALLLSWAVQTFLIPVMQADAVTREKLWYPILQVAVNDVSVYLPGFLVIPPLLAKIPRAEKVPVDRLMFGEFVQAVLFSMGALYLFAGLTGALVTVIEQVSGIQTSNVVDDFSNMLPLWLMVLTTVIIAPIVEEVIFRKLMLDRLRGLGDLSAVLLSALAFALFHTNLYQFIYAFVLGMIFACVVLITGSIRDVVVLHMIINGTSVLTGMNLPDFAWMLFEVFVVLCVLSFFCLFLVNCKKYHLEQGPLSFREGEKLQACLSSPWFWVMLVGGLTMSVVMIFL